jgi:hypothetical protein
VIIDRLRDDRRIRGRYVLSSQVREPELEVVRHLMLIGKELSELDLHGDGM